MQKLLQFRMKTKMLEFSLPQIWSPGSSNQKSLLGKETSSMMTFDLDLATTILARQPNTTVRGHEPLPSVTAGDPLPSASTRRTDRGGRYQKNVWMADVPRRMIKLLGRWLTIGHCCGIRLVWNTTTQPDKDDQTKLRTTDVEDDWMKHSWMVWISRSTGFELSWKVWKLQKITYIYIYIGFCFNFLFLYFILLFYLF